MTHKEYRKLMVSEQSGYRYNCTQAIRILGKWIEELGFRMGDRSLRMRMKYGESNT